MVKLKSSQYFRFINLNFCIRTKAPQRYNSERNSRQQKSRDFTASREKFEKSEENPVVVVVVVVKSLP